MSITVNPQESQTIFSLLRFFGGAVLLGGGGGGDTVECPKNVPRGNF